MVKKLVYFPQKIFQVEDISLEEFLNLSKENGVNQFLLSVFSQEAVSYKSIFAQPFYMNAFGLASGKLSLIREKDYLRRVCYFDQNCTRLVPMISSSSWEGLVVTSLERTKEYASCAETRLKIKLPQRLFAFELNSETAAAFDCRKIEEIVDSIFRASEI